MKNFSSALDNLRDRYGGLLSEEESKFIEGFFSLPQDCQCLLTRMLMRKGPRFRRATLQYPEVRDTAGALQTLADGQWIDLNPIVDLEQLSRTLEPQEWRESFGSAVRRNPLQDSQLTLPLQASAAEARAMAQWHQRLAHRYVEVRVAATAKRLQWLYFGNDWQTWAEFVLADLGVLRHERVGYDAASCAFQSRNEVEHFHRLNDCRERLREGEAAAEVFQAAAVPASVTAWLAAEFGQLHVRIGQILQREGDNERALAAYRASGIQEGRIRMIRLQERLGLHAQSRAEAEMALALPCSEAERVALKRSLLRTRRRLGEAVQRPVPAAKPSVMALFVPPLEEQERVERRICALLNTEEEPAFYVENSLFPSLFGLLCWDAVFVPLPGAFFHSFQSGPADLYTREFRSRRAALLGARLSLLEGSEYKGVIWRTYREKAGIINPFIRWGRMKPQILTLALACIPPAHLRLVFERMLDDLENNCSGLPDLIQFTPGEKQYRLVEVKAPGDRLQDNQRRWMEFFCAHGIPAVVCSVGWMTTDSHANITLGDDLHSQCTPSWFGRP